MISIIAVLSSASDLIFLIILYQMVWTMAERASFNVSFIENLGFHDKENRKLYLDGNFLLMASGVLPDDCISFMSQLKKLTPVDVIKDWD